MGSTRGPFAKTGEVLKLHVRQSLGDTVLRDTRKSIPEYQELDSTVMSKDAFMIFGKACIGDSLVFKVNPDSVLKKKFPEYGESMLVTTVRVLNIYANRDSALKDQDYELKRAKLDQQPIRGIKE